MIQRYDLVSSFDDCDMEPSEDGEFVRYEDHAVLERHLEAIRSGKVWYADGMGWYLYHPNPKLYNEKFSNLDDALKAFDEIYPVAKTD